MPIRGLGMPQSAISRFCLTQNRLIFAVPYKDCPACHYHKPPKVSEHDKIFGEYALIECSTIVNAQVDEFMDTQGSKDTCQSPDDHHMGGGSMKEGYAPILAEV